MRIEQIQVLGIPNVEQGIPTPTDQVFSVRAVLHTKNRMVVGFRDFGFDLKGMYIHNIGVVVAGAHRNFLADGAIGQATQALVAQLNALQGTGTVDVPTG